MQILDLANFYNDTDNRVNGRLTRFNFFKFSGGEVHIKIGQITIKENTKENQLIIHARLNSSDEIMLLLMAVDSLKRLGIEHISLFAPYLPYARQDRVMVKGEPLSIKVMADLINGCGFKSVFIYDVHSEVSTALLNNCINYSNEKLARNVLGDKKDYLLISPDAGAAKKVFTLASGIGYTDKIVICGKVRDLTNGKIIKTLVDTEDLEGKDCYIVDDICDGGATFIEIAKELKLRNCGKIFLIVSHGIFSKGEEELKNHLDHIYTTNSIKDSSTEFITRYNITKLV